MATTYRSEELDLVQGRLCVVLSALHHLHGHKPLPPGARTHTQKLQQATSTHTWTRTYTHSENTHQSNVFLLHIFLTLHQSKATALTLLLIRSLVPLWRWTSLPLSPFLPRQEYKTTTKALSSQCTLRDLTDITLNLMGTWQPLLTLVKNSFSAILE